MPVVGIDVGTSAVRVASSTRGPARGAPPVVRLEELEAVVGLGPDGALLVGRDATCAADTAPSATLRGVKRLLGLPASHPLVAKVTERAGVVRGSTKDGRLVLSIGDAWWEPTSLVALLVARALETLRPQIGDGPVAAVVGTPPSFRGERTKALREALVLAGLETVRLVPETVAAAATVSSLRKARREVLIVDVGASHVAAALVRMKPGEAPQHVAASSREVGGDDVDAALVRFACARLGLGSPDPASRELLLQACEALKRELVLAPDAVRFVPPLPCGFGGGPLEVTADRLDGFLSGLAEAVRACCRECLGGRRSGDASIDEVHLVGGMSRISAVSAAIEDVLGRRAKLGRATTTAVALGAAELAATLRVSEPTAGARRRAAFVPARHEGPVVAVSSGERAQGGRRGAGAARGRRAPVPARPPPTPEPGAAPAQAPTDDETARGASRDVERAAQGRLERFPGAFGRGRPIRATAAARHAADMLDAARALAVLRARRTTAAGPTTEARSDDEPVRAAVEEATFEHGDDAEVGARTPEPDAVPAAAASPVPDEAEAVPTEPADLAVTSCGAEVPDEQEARAADVADEQEARPEGRPASTPEAADRGAPRPPDGPPFGYPPPYWPPPGYPGAPPYQPFWPPYGAGPGGPAVPPAWYPPGPPPGWAPGGPAQTASTPAAVPESTARAEALEPVSGRIANPSSAAELLAMPLTRPLAPRDLDAVALPVLLLRVLGRPSVTGTLTLTFEGAAPLLVPIVQGRAYHSRTERAALLASFDRREGSYCFDGAMPQDARGKPEPVRRLALDGLRAMIRVVEPTDIAEAFEGRFDLAPSLGPEQRLVLDRLGLSESETRIALSSFDGTRTARTLIAQAGTYKRTTTTVLVLLLLFELVELVAVAAPRERDLAAELEERAGRMRSADRFGALSVHWSATNAEVRGGFERTMAEHAEGSELDRAAPEACAAIRRIAGEAYAVVGDETKRQRYRRELLPTLNFDAVVDVLVRKAQAFEMKDDAAQAGEVRRMIREIAAGRRKPRKG